MNSWGGACHRPTGEGFARAPTTTRPWHEHDRHTALKPFGCLPGPWCFGWLGRRERLPARCLAPYNSHRLVVHDVVRG